jgi:ferrous iron transport protein A
MTLKGPMKLPITLTTLSLQDIGLISHIDSDCPDILKKKLLAMGFIRNTPVKVIRIAPLGCPLEIEIAGSRLSLRKSETNCVLVQTQVC